MRSARMMTLAFSAVLLAQVSPALAQDKDGNKDKEFVHFEYVNDAGDLFKTKTPNTANIHVLGGLSWFSAKYFRGVYNGVNTEADTASINPSVGMSAEYGRLGFTAGIWNGITNQERHDFLSPRSWYQANAYAGLTLNIPEGILLGGEYVVYGSPDQSLGVLEEFNMIVKYAGDNLAGQYQPFVKAAIPKYGRDGYFLQFGVTPNVTVNKASKYPVTLSLPFVAGAGMGYYVHGVNKGYLDVAGTATVPLKFIPTDYGAWIAEAGFHFIEREDLLVALGQPYDTSGNEVYWGSVAIKFVF